MLAVVVSGLRSVGDSAELVAVAVAELMALAVLRSDSRRSSRWARFVLAVVERLTLGSLRRRRKRQLDVSDRDMPLAELRSLECEVLRSRPKVLEVRIRRLRLRARHDRT